MTLCLVDIGDSRIREHGAQEALKIFLLDFLKLERFVIDFAFCGARWTGQGEDLLEER